MKKVSTVHRPMAFRWFAIEIAFMPFLDKAQAAMDKSDFAGDPTTSQERGQKVFLRR